MSTKTAKSGLKINWSTAKMAEPIKVVIVMDGGLINQVLTAGPEIEVVIVDYDIEGIAENNIETLDEDGPAYISRHSVDVNGEFVLKAFEAAERLS